jgi:hypothetical protein
MNPSKVESFSYPAKNLRSSNVIEHINRALAAALEYSRVLRVLGLLLAMNHAGTWESVAS